MKPKKLDVATDYRLALLWLVERLASARTYQAIAAFEEEYGDLIPEHHREVNNTGATKWETYVRWARQALVDAGLMGSGGRGVWTIAPAGREWLRQNPDADHANLGALIRQGGAEITTRFRWRGTSYAVRKRSLFSRARRVLKEGPPPEALRYRSWAVLVGGQPVSVKWLFALATGADLHQFNSPTARRALSKIGIEADQVGDSRRTAQSVARRPRGADRVTRRDGFLTQVVEKLSTNLPTRVDHGEVKLSPGRNLVQVMFDAFPRSHYELWLARGFDQIGFHLEGGREHNLARLAHLEPCAKEFSAALGQRVVAERWGQNYARVAMDFSPAPWTEEQATQYAVLLARFIEVTFDAVREAFVAVPSRTRRASRTRRPTPRDAPDSPAHAVLDQQLGQIRSFLHGRASRPSDEVLCEWLQFCYTFELFEEGRQLFQLIDRSAVNDWLYDRAKKLARVCRIRSR